MIWIIIIVSVIAMFVLGFILEDKGVGIGGFVLGCSAFLLFLLLIVATVGTFVSSMNHVNDLESVQYHQERIDIQQERLERLTGVLEEFEYPEGALLNADSPVASIVDQISETEISIAEAKERVAEVNKDIRARKRWIFSYVTKIIE